ncbi:membrane protein insertase YidC, partial [Francisella tularensis subsp. holarctica]|nr:membrane protein insertase YidC [Francisella tularensis subsp. holarctica]
QNIQNTPSAPGNVNLDDSFARDIDPAGDCFSLLNAHSYTFTGVAYSTAKDSFRKESCQDISKTNGQPTVIKSDGNG